MSKSKDENFGTVGLILSIAGFCLSFVPFMNYFGIVFGILAIIFSIITFRKKNSAAKAVTSLILGILSVIIASAMLFALHGLSHDSKEMPKKDTTVTFGEFMVEEGLYSTSAELPVTI